MASMIQRRDGGDLLRLGDCGQDEDEFVAADPGQEVTRVEFGLDAFGDLHEQIVSGSVAVRVV